MKKSKHLIKIFHNNIGKINEIIDLNHGTMDYFHKKRGDP